MSSWLQSIMAELENLSVEDALAPEFDVKDGEHIVGTAGDELRKLSHLSMQYKQRSAKIVTSLMMLPGKKHEYKMNEACIIENQAEELKNIFWMSCRYAFPELWNKPSIGIRKGWKVVWFEEKHPADEIVSAFIKSDIFKQMFGSECNDEPEDTVPNSSKLQ